ncbi:hypothetical protein CTAM01_12891, partial [Colletotrichum tamarilloi]
KKGCYPRPRRTGAGSELECRAGGGGYQVARSWLQKRRRTRHSKGIELTRVLWGILYPGGHLIWCRVVGDSNSQPQVQKSSRRRMLMRGIATWYAGAYS